MLSFCRLTTELSVNFPFFSHYISTPCLPTISIYFCYYYTIFLSLIFIFYFSLLYIVQLLLRAALKKVPAPLGLLTSVREVWDVVWNNLLETCNFCFCVRARQVQYNNLKKTRQNKEAWCKAGQDQGPTKRPEEYHTKKTQNTSKFDIGK